MRSVTTESTGAPPTKQSWRFPATFWTANGAELFERAAYYGVTIALAMYLTDRIGFSDVKAGWVAGSFTALLYLMPTFSGIMADKIGFRRALLLAFGLLTVGYAVLGAGGWERLPIVQRKLVAVAALGVVMFGGSIIKPVISGTVAKCSDAAHRARAFSIFYAVVNIGAFTGKSAAAPLRQQLGLEYISYYSALMSFCALLLVAVRYRDVDRRGSDKTVRAALEQLWKAVTNFRFGCLILIVAGFWTIQHQLYASMPKYILRLLGAGARPEWLANINPLVVILLVVPVTHLVRRWKPVNTVGLALLIIPISALSVGLSPQLQALVGGGNVALPGVALHPVTVMVVIGIALQGVGECFLSPKFLEFASKQAPPGEVGLYMGYTHLSSFFAYFFGFVISGYLLDAYCPDPNTLPEPVRQQWQLAVAGGAPLPQEYAHAHYIWYVFAGIGVAAFIALLVFKLVTEALDRRRGRSAPSA